jgi:hypothetical protein
MGWTTYIDAFVLGGQQRFYIQRVDENLIGPHPVLRDSRGHFALYSSETAARTAALERDEPLSERPAGVLDLDAASTWCSQPSPKTLDSQLLMSAWHTLIHFGALEEMPVGLGPTDAYYALEQVVDRLHLTAEDAEELLGGRGWTSTFLPKSYRVASHA